jgi:hypothetical protein
MLPISAGEGKIMSEVPIINLHIPHHYDNKSQTTKTRKSNKSENRRSWITKLILPLPPKAKTPFNRVLLVLLRGSCEFAVPELVGFDLGGSTQLGLGRCSWILTLKGNHSSSCCPQGQSWGLLKCHPVSRTTNKKYARTRGNAGNYNSCSFMQMSTRQQGEVVGLTADGTHLARTALGWTAPAVPYISCWIRTSLGGLATVWMNAIFTWRPAQKGPEQRSF